MPVQAGTAYVKVDADFSTFERQLTEQLRRRMTQRVELQVDPAAVREQVRTATRPVTQDVHMRLDQGSMQKTESEAKGFFGRIGTLGKVALGGAAVFVGAQVFDAVGERIKSATESALALGRAADALHSATGLTIGDSARLVASANALDIPTRTLSTSLKTLSSQYVGAEGTSKKARASFQELGITQKELNATHGNTEKLLELVSERLDKTQGSAQKTAAAAALLGRGWLQLNPLLGHGGENLRELNTYAEKLGITFDKNTSKNTDKAELSLAKWHLTEQAVQLFIVNKLVPAFLKFTDWFEKKGLPALKDLDKWFNKNILPTLDDVAKKINKDVVPALEDVGGAVGGFVKHNPDLAAAAVSIAAIAGSAAKLKDSALGRGIGLLLKLTGLKGVKLPGIGGGGASASATMEVGEMTVGTLIAKTMIGGGGGGGPGGVVSDLEKGAGEATLLSRLKTLLRGSPESPAGGAESFAKLAGKSPLAAAALPFAGLLAFTGANKADNNAKSKIVGAIEAVDPTSVLNLFGMPSVSQMLFGDPSAGRKSWERVTSGHPDDRGLGHTSAGKPGGPAPIKETVDAKQQTKDFLAMNTQLSKLETHQQGVKATAFNLDYLAKQAKKVGDVKWDFADRMGAQFVKSGSVSSKGVQNIIKEMGKLAPGARKQAELGAIQMAEGLAAEGKLPKNAATTLTNELLTALGKLPKGAKTSAGQMADHILDSLKLIDTKGVPNNSRTMSILLGQFDNLRKKGGPKWTGMKDDAILAFQDLQLGVVPTGNSTAAALYKAFQAMGINANELAKALGIKPITLKLTPLQTGVEKLNVGKQKQLQSLQSRAGGGLIQIGEPGMAGQDRVPLNMGGIPIAVGEGEQVAVFNRHQAPIMNEALARMGYGGLPGLFQSVSRLNYMAGGGLLPGRRFAGGGTFSYGQLEGLWDQAGGAKNMAPLMAAIALAESGGNASIVNSIGASGLWQIHPAMPGDLNPLQNARYAVGKLRDQGLTAWETYTNGAYRQFLHGGVPAIMGAGAVSKIARALITGPAGGARDLAQGGADWGRNAIDHYLATHAPAIPAMGLAGPGSPGGPTGVGNFQGFRVANWVIAALRYAQSRGVNLQVTSGYRPGRDPHTASGTSEHQGTQYPHGAVDFGGPVDYPAYVEKMKVVGATSDFKWPLLAPVFHNYAAGAVGGADDGHASGTGFAGGGLVPGFAGGGIAKYPHWPSGRSNWDAHNGFTWWVNYAMRHGLGHPGIGMGSGQFYTSLYDYFRTRSSSRIPREAWQNWHGRWDQSYTGYAPGGLVRGFAGGTGAALTGLHAPRQRPKPWWSQALDTLKQKGPVPQGKDLGPLLGNLRSIGLSGWDKPLAKHGGDIARDQALETVASGLINTDKIATLLTADPSLWPDPTQPIGKDSIHSILQRQGAVVQGKDALQWLGKQLGDQMAQRRSLVNLASHVQKQYAERRKILTAAKARREKIKADIRNTQNEIKNLNTQLHPKGKTKPPTGATRKQLTAKLNTKTQQLTGATRQLAAVESVISVTENQIGNLNTAWGADLGGGSLRSMYDLYGPTSSGGSGTTGVLGQLYGLQGPVTDQRILGMGSSAQDLVNALPGSLTNWYGDIGTTLGSMNTFGSSFFTAPTPADTAAPTTDPFSLELQRLTSQRDLISQLQAPLIAGYPYGGSFAAGGTVPGPPGQPVMIQAHGGEQVISNDDVAGGHTFEIHGDPRTVALLESMIERVNVSSNRGQARSADRRMRLPGNQVR